MFLSLFVAGGRGSKRPLLWGIARNRIVMDRRKVSSGRLRSVGYDPRSRILEVEFVEGSIVQYRGVSMELHRSMMSASSISSFFHDRVEEEGFSAHRVR